MPVDSTPIANDNVRYTVVSVDGRVIRSNAESIGNLEPGIYIINGKKTLIRK